MPFDTMANDTITDLAVGVATAHHAVQKATATHAAALAEQQIIEDRISEVDEQRNAVIVRRRQGDGRQGDAGEIELLAADRECLEIILAERQAEVAKAQRVLATARHTFAAAQDEMRRAEDEATHANLKAHAAKLDELLLQTIGQINEVRSRLGDVRPSWAPSKALYHELRKLAAQTGML